MINSSGVLASSCTEALAIETEGCSESEGGGEAWNVLELTFPSVLGGEAQTEPFWNSVCKSKRIWLHRCPARKVSGQVVLEQDAVL